MKSIAIIPARGGSKRLPRKNILDLLGKPLLYFPITSASNSKLFDDIYVSTDDKEIAEIAASIGANVINRPKNISTDNATVVQACLHALEYLRPKKGLPDSFCCIYATAVFIVKSDLINSYNMMNSMPLADFVIGVSDFNLQPMQALVEKGSYLIPKWPNLVSAQSQTQPNMVASNGTIYWARTKKFLETKTFYGNKLKGFKISRIRAIDLDTLEDYELLKILAPHILNKKLIQDYSSND